VVSENKLLRRAFGNERQETKGDEGNCRMRRWVGHVACLGDIKIHKNFCRQICRKEATCEA
jgi:hypothetical protein